MTILSHVNYLVLMVMAAYYGTSLNFVWEVKLAWSYPALLESTGVMHSAEATRIFLVESLPARCLCKCLFDDLD